jgi:hypothetical protein
MSNQILEQIKAEITAFDAKKKMLLAELQTQFPSMFIELFKKAPNLKSFGWRQYTPYFNDGDSCVFRVHFDYPYINGASEDYDEECDISIKIHGYKVLETEEDVHINDEVAEKSGYTWYKGNQIGDNGLCYNTDYDEAAATAVDQIQEVLNSIPEDFFLDLFGDHAKVTIYADGTIDVEEYDHD